MKKIYFFLFVLSCIIVFADSASAQDSGGQDSTGLASPPLRARRDTYIIVPFPSPARHGQTMQIHFYNHNPQEVSLRIVDMLDRTVKELQAPATLMNGIHSYDFNTGLVSNGTYFIRLTTYTSTGSLELVQDMRFIVLH